MLKLLLTETIASDKRYKTISDSLIISCGKLLTYIANYLCLEKDDEGNQYKEAVYEGLALIQLHLNKILDPFKA